MRKRIQIELSEAQDEFVSGYAQSHTITKTKACTELIQAGIIKSSSDLFEDGINEGVRKTMEAVSLVDQRMREELMCDVADEINDTLDALRITQTALMLFMGAEDNPKKLERCYRKAEQIVFDIKE